MTNGLEFGISLFNFLLLCFILKSIVYDAVKKSAQQRSEMAQKRIGEAEEIYQAAKTNLDKYRKLTESLEQEKKQIQADAEHDAQVAREEIAAQAEREAKNTEMRARREAGAESGAAVSRIRADIAEAAIKRAGELLKSSLDEASEQNIIENFLVKVGAEHAK